MRIPQRLVGRMDLSFIYKKLFTKEDPQQIHKILGFASLVSFAYRYFVVFPKQGDLGFDGSIFDWFTMFLHLALSCSSIIFHVLTRRILSKPMIIWHEYRLHAMSFTARCVCVFLCGYFRPFAGTDLETIVTTCSVLIWHLLADEISNRHGVHEQTTVRMDNKSTFLTKLVLRFYAFYQFAAVASHLSPNHRVMDMGFNTLIAIQSSAFLMTLFRKGLIAYYTHGLFYTFALVLSIGVMTASFSKTAPFACYNLFVKTFVVYGARVFFPYTPRWMTKYHFWVLFAIFSTPSAAKFVSLARTTAEAWETTQATSHDIASFRFTGALFAWALWSVFSCITYKSSEKKAENIEKSATEMADDSITEHEKNSSFADKKEENTVQRPVVAH